MATKLICDRCHSESNGSGFRSYRSPLDDHLLDFCSSCYQKFKVLFNKFLTKE